MGYFNIDFSKFDPKNLPSFSPKPSSSPTPTASPSPLPKLNTPSMPTPSVPAPSPAPISTPAPMPEPSTTHGKFFSGSMLSKLFDVLQLPIYGYAGYQKAGLAEKARQNAPGGELAPGGSMYNPNSKLAPFKAVTQRLKAGFSGILPGIQNRTQFSGQEGDVNMGQALGIKDPYAQEAYNLGLTFATPTIPFEKAGNLISKIPGVNKIPKAIEAIGEFAKTKPFLYKPIEVFNPYFRNPEVGKLVDQATEVSTSRVSELYQRLRSLASELAPGEQRAITNIIEKGTDGPPKLVAIADEVRSLSNKIGQEAVDAGLLSAKSFEKYKNNYIPHVFEKYANPSGTSGFVGKVRDFPKVAGKFFKKRTGAEGNIAEFAPATFFGLGNEIKDIEVANLFKNIAGQFGTKLKRGEQAAEGYVKASQTLTDPIARKIFAGLAIPTEVADYVSKVKTVTPMTTYDKLLNAWKAGKTIWNPAYHARNIVSNQILSDMSTGRGLLGTAKDALRSARELAGKGEQTFVNAAEKIGLIKTGGVTGKFNDLLDASRLRSSKSFLQKVSEAPGKFQGMTEDSAKLNVFTNWIKKLADDAGVAITDALKDPTMLRTAKNEAEKAIFSPYRISSAERSLASRVVPFYSFTRQALPFTLETAYKHPDRIVKYPRIQTAIESLSKDNVPYSKRPDYYQQQIRLPFTDNQGRGVYFDPTYIYPFGNFLDAGGTGGQLPFGMSLRPDLAEVAQQSGNIDFWTGKPIASSNIPERAAGQRFSHLFNTVAPTAAYNVANKLVPSLTGQPDQYGRYQDPAQAIMSSIFGLKTTNIGNKQLEQSATRNQSATLRSIQAEEKQIMQDQSLSEAEKARLIQRLREVYQSQ